MSIRAIPEGSVFLSPMADHEMSSHCGNPKWLRRSYIYLAAPLEAVRANDNSIGKLNSIIVDSIILGSSRRNGNFPAMRIPIEHSDWS